MNQLIKKEILARINNIEKSLSEMPDVLKPLLEYYKAQSVNALARKLVDVLEDAIQPWPKDKEIQAAGFEWYYDGGFYPEAPGYAYTGVITPPDFSSFEFGKSGKASDGFNGGIEFGPMLFGDSGGFEVAPVCYPLYEFLESKLGEDHWGELDLLIELFTLRMFYCMHLALGHVAGSESFKSLNIAKPFYLFANNHDWNPFLIYAQVEDASGDEPVDLGENSSIEVEDLNGWFAYIQQKISENNQRKEMLNNLNISAPKGLETVLLRLPYLSNRGQSTLLSIDELKTFCWGPLSKPEFYKKISTEAFVHFFTVVLSASKELSVYDISYAMVFLFLNNPKEAYNTIREIIEKEPEKKSAIQDCAKDTLRWAAEHNETRWDNPNFSLYKSGKAKKYMKKLLKL
ncbi:MAG: hypothetical protein GY754_14010 [bacterium]|nr:hypothetical protein [bacterium]